MDLERKIEGVLFYKGTALKVSALAKLFNATEEEINTSLQALSNRLKEGGTSLIQTENEAQLVTTPELDELIESIRKDDLKRDIGKAGAETLAVILYKGPISRAEIDRIRGVNSSFILRNLMVRGLINRGGEGRSFNFDITPELLMHLGISRKTDLPDYSTVLDQLEQFEVEVAESENS